MNEPDPWRQMSSAPKDGTRILVTVRPVEQGPAEVDVAYWARADQFASEGWRAADSISGMRFRLCRTRAEMLDAFAQRQSGQAGTCVRVPHAGAV